MQWPEMSANALAVRFAAPPPGGRAFEHQPRSLGWHLAWGGRRDGLDDRVAMAFCAGAATFI